MNNFITIEDFSFCQQTTSCGNKKKYSKKNHAEQAIERMFFKKKAWNIENLIIYQCKFCNSYHYGHQNS
jgi:hypothetical protein